MRITRLLTNTIGTAMLAGALMLAPQAAQARVFISVGFAPPAIPVYEQPICPGDGYIWTPGYWEYTDDGYEWVDGAWVVAPYVGALWTPGYWGYGGGGYFWNAGYWGPSIGYYGGINYGFGYFGTGFYGGYWNGGHFFYNRAYNHFGAGGGFRNVYERRIDGFDGHPGGTSFARGLNNENRGGSFNRTAGFNGSGFGQSGNTTLRATNQPYRGINGSGTAGSFAQNRGGYSEARPLNNVAPGYGGNTGVRPAAPVNNFHPSQGASQGASEARGFTGGIAGNTVRPAAPVNNFHPSQGGTAGGGQHVQSAPSFHGGGGGFHGGGGGHR